jgi:hypothetical protein
MQERVARVDLRISEAQERDYLEAAAEIGIRGGKEGTIDPLARFARHCMDEHMIRRSKRAEHAAAIEAVERKIKAADREVAEAQAALDESLARMGRQQQG